MKKQKAYKMVDQQFDSFVINNRNFIEEALEDGIYKVQKSMRQNSYFTTCGKRINEKNDYFVINNNLVRSNYTFSMIRIFEDWNIKWLAFCDESLIFMNSQFDKVYIYDLRE